MKKKKARVVKHEKIIRTWKQIAVFLDVSERTLRRKYAAFKNTENPMPVTFDGTATAIPEDLRSWLRKNKMA